VVQFGHRPVSYSNPLVLDLKSNDLTSLKIAPIGRKGGGGALGDFETYLKPRFFRQNRFGRFEKIFGKILFVPTIGRCYSMRMEKTVRAPQKLSFIGLVLVALVVLFAGVLTIGWQASVELRHMVAANAAVMNVDSSAQIERERLRSLAEAQVSNSRAYFLLGSKSVFEKQKADKERFVEGVAKFVKENSTPEIEAIAKSIDAIEKQESDFFDQATAFRNKATESKIVAQFYHSKTNPLLAQLDDQFDKIAKLQNAALEEARTRAQNAGNEAQAQIPKNMIWLMTAVSGIFLCATILVVWLLISRRAQQRVRDRLYEDAQKSALARDELMAAIGQDLKEPLAELEDVAKILPPEPAEAIKSVVDEINTAVSDMIDQTRADMGSLTLRLEQLALANVLEEAQATLQPLAKKKDVTLQFDTVNPSILAYYDRERVLRVLSNLVSNAIKFSPKNGRVQIKVKSDAQFANISVIDSGPGLSDARMSAVFENFWQAKATASQGPGIGLAIVKTIVDAHGGTVRAEKNLLGGGCVFTFSLPRRLPAGVTLKKRSASSVKLAVKPKPHTYDNYEGPSA
jgi:signal transduction histidine kinase